MVFGRNKAAKIESPELRAARLIAEARAAKDADLDGVVIGAVAALSDASPLVRRAALEAIGQAGLRGASSSHMAGSAVLELVRDEAPMVRAEVASTLALFPVEKAGGDPVTALRTLLEDEAPGVREEAAAALGDARDRGTLDALAAHLKDISPGVRFECAYALATLEDARGRDTLLDALERPEWRVLAADVLGKLGDQGAVPRLLELAERKLLHWSDRLHVLGALYRLGEPSAGPKIVARVRAFGRTQREYALWMIGSASVREGFLLLAEIARTRGHGLREAALRALGVLSNPLGAEVLLEVARDLATPAEVRAEAARRLGEIEGPGRRAALDLLSESEDALTREAAREARAELATREAGTHGRTP